MKKLFIMIAVLAFMVSAPFAMAKKESKVNCCVSGKCQKLTKAACKDAGGKVVKSCKSCKPKK